MTTVVPLQAIPNQVLQVVLDNQSCVLEIYQQDYGLYMNVTLGNQLIVAGVLCLNLVKIVRGSIAAIGTPGFSGDFAFFDSEASTDPDAGEDPVYTGLGSRFLLLYYSEADLTS